MIRVSQCQKEWGGSSSCSVIFVGGLMDETEIIES